MSISKQGQPTRQTATQTGRKSNGLILTRGERDRDKET